MLMKKCINEQLKVHKSFIMCIGTSPTLFRQAPPHPPLKPENCVTPTFLGNFPPIYWFFMNPPTPPPLKIGFFCEPP